MKHSAILAPLSLDNSHNLTNERQALFESTNHNPAFSQVEFMSDLANAAMIPNVMFLTLNGMFGHRLRMDRR